MAKKYVFRVLLLAGLAVPFGPVRADDRIDQLLRSGHVPKALLHEHGYSDFTDPLGRFMDLLAAGAVTDAQVLFPAACAAWLAKRQESPLTGKFRALDIDLDLNELCETR